MIALLDGDILTYRVGFTTMEDEGWVAIARVDESIRTICQALGINEYRCFLTSQDKSNYRFNLYPDYKANRKDSTKPTHYSLIRDHLIEAHGAEVSFGEEADDRMGITQAGSGDGSTIICTIDKDLDQIPGWHFNFVKGLKYSVSELDGEKWFYSQMLIGDVSDNIKGITGIGKIKASKLLNNLSNVEQFHEAVSHEYKNEFGDAWLSRYILIGRLLRIRRKEGELWLPPNTEVDLNENLEVSSNQLDSSSNTNQKH